MSVDSAKVRRKLKIQARDGPGCLLCGYKHDLTLHHIKKKSDGGSNNLDNLVVLCQLCHVYYHQTEAKDFLKWVEQTRNFLIKIIND